MTIQPRSKRLLLVTWPGAGWQTFQNYAAAGALPQASALLGAGGPVRGVAPGVVPAQWISLATGKRPHQHGLLHTHTPRSDGSGVEPVTGQDNQATTFAEILSDAGRRVHQLAWPLSHPARRSAGIWVSDQFALAGLRTSIDTQGAPPWIDPDRAAAEIFARRRGPDAVDQLTLAQILPDAGIDRAHRPTVERAVRTLIAETATLIHVANWLAADPHWECASCTFPMLARLDDLPAQLMAAAEPEARREIERGCYEYLDLILGQLVRQAGDEATIVLGSADAAGSGTPFLIFSGPDVTTDGLTTQLSILDLVPTLLAFLGLPVGRDMDGAVRRDLFRAEAGIPPEVTFIDTWDRPRSPDTPRPPDATQTDGAKEATAATGDASVRHLVELGYTHPADSQARELAVRVSARETDRNRALSLLDGNHPEEAITVLEQLERDHREWSAPHEILANSYCDAGHLEAAQREVDWLTHHGFESDRLYLIRARLSLFDRRVDEALDHLHVAERLGSRQRSLHAVRGKAWLRKGDLVAAEKAFQSALAATGPDASLLDGLAACQLGQRAFESAAELCLEAIAASARYAPAHYHLGLALVGMQRPDDAFRAFENSTSANAHFAPPYYWMARIARESRGQPDQARNYLRRGVELIHRRRRRASRPAVEPSAPATPPPDHQAGQ